MGSVITNPMSNDLINFKDNADIKNKPKTVEKIIELTNDHNNLRFIKEIIDLTRREKRKNKTKQKSEMVKTESKKKNIQKQQKN